MIHTSEEHLNDSIDESEPVNNLNETYTISQDDSSEYSHIDRRTSSGSSIHYDQNILRPNEPLLKDIEDVIERENLFNSKIELCCKIYDYTLDPLSDFEDKETKSCALMEIEEILLEEPNLVSCFDSFYKQIFRMITANIFRVLPPPQSHPLPEYDPEDDDPPLEPSWPNLSLVYDLFTKFLDKLHFDNERAKPYVDRKFLSSLISLFASEDPREREYLKTILHRLYGKYIDSRAYIRNCMSNFFLAYMYDHGNHTGVAELLEVMGSIVNGFIYPLKDEHKKFLFNVVLPLHKHKALATYHSQLTYCAVQYIDRDAELAVPIINYLLKHWPRLASTREVMYLSEMEELVDVTDEREFRKVMVKLFKQLAICITSDQFQVAERCLYMWNNEYFTTLVARNSTVLMPILFPALNRDPNLHWNKTINGLIYNALKMLSEMNPILLHELDTQYQEEKSVQKKQQQQQNQAQLTVARTNIPSLGDIGQRQDVDMQWSSINDQLDKT